VGALQLAAYRLAFARLRGLDPEQVDAAFYYAASGETVWPPLPDEAELVRLLATVPGVGDP
jgi:DNA helicase-2/ATP-dependent DNA helicase PcrA